MTRKEARRFDALIALPLARFRTALGRLTPEELAALEARIELLAVKERWALGSHGVARHRAPIALGLLARRLAEARREAVERRTQAAQLRLLEPEPGREEPLAPALSDLAA